MYISNVLAVVQLFFVCTHLVRETVWFHLLFPLAEKSSSAGVQPTKSSPSSCYVNINQTNDGRANPWQTPRWLQAYVSNGFTAVVLFYVCCHPLFYVFHVKTAAHTLSFCRENMHLRLMSDSQQCGASVKALSQWYAVIQKHLNEKIFKLRIGLWLSSRGPNSKQHTTTHKLNQKHISIQKSISFNKIV